MKRILVVPLNWGLGHASRCIPLIRDLQSQGHEVIAGADGGALALLRAEVPGLTTFLYPDVRIRYSAVAPFYLNLLFRSPTIFRAILREHEFLRQIVKQYHPEMIISDNRYGVWHPEVESVLITHQLYPIAPFGIQRVLLSALQKIFRNFNEVWIPDFEGENNLSGILSHRHTVPSNAKYIGPLSRFSGAPCNTTAETYQFVGIVSGPEPHRQHLCDELIALFSKLDGKCLLVTGLPGKGGSREESNLQIVSHMPSADLREAVCGARHLVTRSGYSSLMDLYALGRRALLVPTPGQTEQEYLASYHAAKGHHGMARQGHLGSSELFLQKVDS